MPAKMLQLGEARLVCHMFFVFTKFSFHVKATCCQGSYAAIMNKLMLIINIINRKKKKLSKQITCF